VPLETLEISKRDLIRNDSARLLPCAYFDPWYKFNKLATVDGTPAQSCPQRYMSCKMR